MRYLLPIIFCAVFFIPANARVCVQETQTADGVMGPGFIPAAWCRVRRQGNIVQLDIGAARAAAGIMADRAVWCTIPDGFRPSVALNTPVVWRAFGANSGVTGIVAVLTNGEVVQISEINTPGSTSSGSIQVTFIQ